MIPRILVEQRLGLASSIMDGHALDLMGMLHELLAYVDTLPWQGSAAQAHLNFHETWHQAARGMYGDTGTGGVLGQISTGCRITFDNYVAAETANRQTWAM
jgi:hypothetical protein